MAKAISKKRPDKYDPKLAIKGSFEDVILVSVTPKEKLPIAKKKAAKK